MPAPAARRALRLLLFGAIAAAASAFDQVDAPDDDPPEDALNHFDSDGEPTAARRQPRRAGYYTAIGSTGTIFFQRDYQQ